jgi:6-phosphogluconolactonase (cycloisomerase 2 family)
MSSRVSIQQFVSNTEPSGVALGDEWYVPSTGLLYKRTAVNGTQTSWVNLAVIPSGGVSNQVLTYGTNSTLTWTTSSSGISGTYSGIFTITNTSSSISTSTGALIVVGGAGIGGNLNIGGNVTTSRFIQSPYQPVAPRSLVYQGTGALTPLTTAPAGLNPYGVAIDPTGRFLYTANNGDATVSQFAINTSTGVLTTVSNAISASNSVWRIIADPTGRFVYALSSSNRISQYSINQTTGVLTSLGTVFTSETGGSTYHICVDPTGRFVYTGNLDNNFIRQWAINQTTGVLTQITTDISTGAGTGPQSGIQVDPSGRFLYLCYTTSYQLGQYAINQTTGALTLIAAPVAVAINLSQIAIEPSGRFLYATCTGIIYQFSIDQNSGALTQVTSQLGPSFNLAQITIDPNGRFLYGIYSAGFVQYSINQRTGTLTQVDLLLYTGTGSMYQLMVDPTGRFLYAPYSSNSSVVLIGINNFSAGSGTISGSLNIASTVSSTSTTTGALQIAGGVGIGGNLTITNYTETRFTSTVTSNAITLSLNNGTFQTITTMVGANAITLPTVASGKSLTVQILYASTPTTLTFATPSGTLKWPGGTAPTPTLTNTKYDFYTFVSDGTNWYGIQSGANF